MEKAQQQIDIVAHLEKLLFEHETVIIPTFGGFTATRAAAAVDLVGGTVAPPSKSLTFNENLTVDDGILVHEIATSTGLDNDAARAVILDFVTQTKNALGNRDIVTFSGIGRLYKNYAQKIQFLPDTANFNTDSFGLPPLQFSPLARGTENGTPPPAAAPAPAASNPAPTFTPPKTAEPEPPKPAPAVAHFPVSAPPPSAPVERSVQTGSPMRSMGAFLTGLLIFAVAVGFYLSNRKKSAAGPTNSGIEPTEQPATVLPTPGAIMDEAQKKAENAIAAEQPKTPAADSDSDKDVADEAEEVTAKKIEAAEKQAVKSKEKDKKSAKNDIADEGGDKRCVLIIGTFKDKKNVDKLLAKLKSNGYDTYHRFVKGHQVGIEFNYENVKEMQEKMEALQKLTGEEYIWIKKQ